MEGKWTPGPWQVSGGRRSDTLYGHGVGPDGGGYVAMVTYSDRAASDHLASLADARLIAAAPALYGALVALLAAVDRMDRPPSRGGGVLPVDKALVTRNARAALSQALGEGQP